MITVFDVGKKKFVTDNNLLSAVLLALKKGRAEIQARCGRQTCGGTDGSDSTLSELFGGEGNALSLEV